MLRGINVSGRNMVKMPQLRELFVGLGHADVVTYIQSGNVVFTSPARSASALAPAIEKRIAANPFAGADLAKVHVTFLAQKPDAGLVRALDGHTSGPDEFRVIGRE